MNQSHMICVTQSVLKEFLGTHKTMSETGKAHKGVCFFWNEQKAALKINHRQSLVK